MVQVYRTMIHLEQFSSGAEVYHCTYILSVCVHGDLVHFFSQELIIQWRTQNKEGLSLRDAVFVVCLDKTKLGVTESIFVTVSFIALVAVVTRHTIHRAVFNSKIM